MEVKKEQEAKLICTVCESAVEVQKNGAYLEYICPECGVLHSIEYQEQDVEKPREFTTLA